MRIWAGWNFRKGQVIQTHADNVVFDFIIPTGQHFAFEVDKIGAKLLLLSLSKILEKIERETGTIELPRQQ
jgi:hypothetical protein